MRHLKVRGVLQPNKEYFDLKVIEQTHFEKGFGGGQNVGANGPWIFVHGEVCLCSYAECSFQVSRYVLNIWSLPKEVNILLRLGYTIPADPEDTPSPDFVIKDLPYYWWGPIKAAVSAYNEFYKDK